MKKNPYFWWPCCIRFCHNAPFAAKMFCLEFCSLGLVPCGIVSNNVFDINVRVAPVSTKSLACIPCILILMYKLDSSNDDPMPIYQLGLQNCWTLLLTDLLDSFLELLCSLSLGCFCTVMRNLTFLVTSRTTNWFASCLSFVTFTVGLLYLHLYLQFVNFISQSIRVSLNGLHSFWSH